MPPVVAVVGNSNSGKTTVAESLIAALAARGYRVAAIKHCPHGHDINRAQSDTHRMFEAGASTVIASSPDQRTRVDRTGGDTPLESIISTLGSGVDLVVAEGFKNSAVPKVLVVRGGPPPPVENVIATVGDSQESEPNGEVPAYGFEEADKLVSQLIAQVFEAGPPAPAVSLSVDGNPVPLIPFISAIMSGIVGGFLATLKGLPRDPEEVQITIKGGAGAAVSIVADRTPVPLAPFPSGILADIVRGLLSNLKGLPEDPAETQITIHAAGGPGGPPPPGRTSK
ncbi:MAG: molybdopterin-guanine dinucleotide biosynthesis protein B [Dehalococcoidia bacterium]|jgi:molybdopterin-guanine dinucleotide biosynthesis protein B|nr:molybdopterin-guanine dinucleotide biosynthesis protein B [Dehalococcoidia bacterium]MDP7083101.1 molybdopterin-guanine dinucleotide biosynthesis protein B [Dehalococcoidia bacterium]MDP7200516.1 molybdopterin-guanine dinucleotide biosynthesis protein B [Dehalococcoidia bacterium]MDP7511304.1 molybdopterin-guanine dinucleotide biosynthesis protein B [Dehalococcoidia bacterium]HJN88027.1 molybdopterin-guanine dinucleotide biosynthesis protein B [Dehalococcoidia bacterium]